MAETLILAGCGKMGSALLGGWLERGIDAADVIVVESFNDTATAVAERFGVCVVAEPGDIPPDTIPQTIVFAVKPQSMDDTVPAYARFVGTSTVFLSIAAGKTIDYFQGNLGDPAAIVRAMPNTPAAVGRGITVACANANTDDAQVRRCDELLGAVGAVSWVDDEGLMDAVTAVSGSGPAYVFLLAECMAEAGINAGLPAELAHQLARETVAGAGELLHRSGETAAELRTNVTSPGGTTHAALEVLMGQGGVSELMGRAIAAATKRSRELA
ncbi:MAG: pyrroline-5-carboxylate reductase [Alphaproteobacteria bacterium]|jgi:pyrroline-5-carboxylate reductase|nr:pyrroline-5-carboxylate reductase [Alphaproteobacteria bacterium]MBT7944334.1 pyrroline-5-carboxylate reductase [Alphaproteobacteria bacterium]